MLSKKTIEYCLEAIDRRISYYDTNRNYLSMFGKERYAELKQAITELTELEAELKERQE